MKVENVNMIIRDMFTNLVNDGYKKGHICGLTLGSQSAPQLESFLKGNDFGIKPLQRLINNLGYEVNLVIVPSSDTEITKFVNEVNTEFITNVSKSLIEKLNNENIVKSATTVKSGIIVDAANDLFDEIFGE
jgi:hypothetical protein